LISIAITYLIPVVSAEIAKRKISVTINTMVSVEEMLLNYWDGKILGVRTTFFPLIDSIISRPKSQGVFCIAFFHSSDRREAFVLNITNLDDYLPYCFLIYQRNKDLLTIYLSGSGRLYRVTS
jgi:hypothetical protein